MNPLKGTQYEKYVKERLNAFILENESGFITYKFVEKECFICEMSIDSEMRGQGNGRSLIGKLSKIADDADCSVISANIYLLDKGASNTLGAALKVGFQVVAADKNVLTIVLKIEGDS